MFPPFLVQDSRMSLFPPILMGDTLRVILVIARFAGWALTGSFCDQVSVGPVCVRHFSSVMN